MVYDPGTRIVLTIRPPLSWGAAARGSRGARRGAESGALVSNVDLGRTLLEAAGLRPPLEWDGESLLPILTGAPAPALGRRNLSYVLTGLDSGGARFEPKLPRHFTTTTTLLLLRATATTFSRMSLR